METVKHDNIAAALAAARGEFSTIKKTSTARISSSKGEYTYTYADTAEILDAVIVALVRHELSITFTTSIADGLLFVNGTLRHSSGGGIESQAFVPAPTDGKPQAWGTAVTYAKRYCLGCLLNLASEQDDDANSNQHESASWQTSRREPRPAPQTRAMPVAQPAPAREANRPAQGQQATLTPEQKKAHNDAAVFAIVETYAPPADVEMWPNLDGKDKNAVYRRALTAAKAADPTFEEPALYR